MPVGLESENGVRDNLQTAQSKRGRRQLFGLNYLRPLILPYSVVQRWDVGKRVRDIEEAPDGPLWMVEDAKPDGLYRLAPK